MRNEALQTDVESERPTWWSWALVVAVVTVIGVIRLLHRADFSSDFDQLWYAARALMAGQDPYSAVGPGRTFEWPWLVYYPLPAILLAAPFALLPIALARFAFTVATGVVVAFALAPRIRRIWPLLLSTSFFLAISRNQWSPFILASLWLPVAGGVLAVKPNVGIISLAGAKSLRHVAQILIAAAASCVIAFAIRPGWVGAWLDAIKDAPNKESAVLQPLGFFLLLNLLRWRSRDARVLLAMSVIPQTPSLYDLLPAFVVVRTQRQALIASLLTHALQWWLIVRGPYQDFNASYDALARSLVLIFLIPMMALGFWNARHPDASDAPSARGVLIDRLLFVLLLLSLGMQMWLVLLQ